MAAVPRLMVVVAVSVILCAGGKQHSRYGDSSNLGFDEPEEGTVFEPGEEVRPDVHWVRHRPAWGPLPRWGLVAFAILLTFGVGYRLVMDWASDQMRPESLFGEDVRFVIEDGWSTNDVAAALGVADVVDNPAMFRQWMRCPSALRWLIDISTSPPSRARP